MYTLDDYSFQYSRAPESSDIPEGYFHILPFRIPPAVEGMEAIEQAKADFGRAVGKEPNVFKLDGEDARSVYFVCPECPPAAFAQLLRFATILSLWDGMSLIGNRSNYIFHHYFSNARDR
jgi:hypothetical protein